MNTTELKSKSYAAVFAAALVALGLVLENPVMAFAHEGRDGFKRSNPPGAVGGPGAGPRWKDNPHRIDNPPGPIGGRGTDWRNPPGPRGGEGYGPHRSQRENRQFFREHPRMRYHAADQKLHRLQAKRARLAEEGGNEERLAKLDEKISRWQSKVEAFREKFEDRKGNKEETAEAVSDTTVT